MNMNSTIGRKLHDAIARMIEGEMAFDADFDNADRCVRNAINAGKREGWR